MGQKDGTKANQPVHEVTIEWPFYMGVFPVTQAQYKAVMGHNPSEFCDCPDSSRRPVEQVSWDDAEAFCKKISRKCATQVMLPSEAQWEYACRAGSIGDFCYGDGEDPLYLYANYDNRPMFGPAGETSAVGIRLPNAWGLYDMHGNVSEWCADHYQSSYDGAPSDGSVWRCGDEDYLRVLRGGCYDSWSEACCSAERYCEWHDHKESNVGFRVCASLVPPG